MYSLKQKFLFVGAILLCTISMVHSQAPVALDTFHQAMKRTGVIGYQALVMKEGIVHWKTASGRLNSQQEEAVDDQTIFVIASLSKPILAIGILRLVDKGLIHLDEPIGPYLPFSIDHPYFPSTPITPRMLLSHTSGIQDNWNVLNQLYRPDSPVTYPLRLETFLRKYLIQSGSYYDSTNFHAQKPGETFDYSNVGYMMLGYLIECITQEKLEDFCYKEIFAPLGMTNTFWTRKDIPHTNIAYPHRIEEDEVIPLPHFGYPSYPEGQIRTSVSDYAKLLSMIFEEGKVQGHPFLQPETVKEMLRIQYPKLNEWQAISWNFNEFGSEEFYARVPHLPAHTGLDPGATTATLFDPSKKSAVLIFNNTEPQGFEGLMTALLQLAQLAGIGYD